MVEYEKRTVAECQKRPSSRTNARQFARQLPFNHTVVYFAGTEFSWGRGSCPPTSRQGEKQYFCPPNILLKNNVVVQISKVFRVMEPNGGACFLQLRKCRSNLITSPASSYEAKRSFSALRRLKTWLRSTMTQIRLIHLVISHVHRDILSELSCQDIAKEFVRSNDARCRVFVKIKNDPDVLHDKQRCGTWASAEIFPEGEKSTFCLSFSGCWRCSAHGRSQNVLPFQHHNENAPCYGNSTKNALRWQQCFFFTHASFDTVENYVANCYQQLLSRFITC